MAAAPRWTPRALLSDEDNTVAEVFGVRSWIVRGGRLVERQKTSADHDTADEEG
ncbi:hypothetical protein [Actinocatenispora comari]|uniref:hypothetical protein n=1 Tax=Actinocatenispora comari TaxID=2807577 RepID=UPI001A924836|nr:hypothetical protein [Actinocatenispora comari]